MRVVKHWNTLPRRGGCPTCGEIHGQVGWGLTNVIS